MRITKTTAVFQPLRGDTVGELELAIERFDKRLRRAAGVVSGGEADVAEDLYQLAIAELWELDPARFDRSDDGYLWRAMMKRMLMVRRGAERDPTRAPLALRFP